MVGVRQEIEGTGIAAEAAAVRAEITAIAPEFVADPDASFQTNFMEALGFQEASLFRPGIFDENVINGEDDFRTQLERVSPEAFLDAIAAADPSQQETIDLIKADPELAEALHGAIVNDLRAPRTRDY